MVIIDFKNDPFYQPQIMSISDSDAWAALPQYFLHPKPLAQSVFEYRSWGLEMKKLTSNKSWGKFMHQVYVNWTLMALLHSKIHLFDPSKSVYLAGQCSLGIKTDNWYYPDLVLFWIYYRLHHIVYIIFAILASFLQYNLHRINRIE